MLCQDVLLTVSGITKNTRPKVKLIAKASQSSLPREIQKPLHQSVRSFLHVSQSETASGCCLGKFPSSCLASYPDETAPRPIHQKQSGDFADFQHAKAKSLCKYYECFLQASSSNAPVNE
eukprot:4259960-Amphidinium_carterae.2